MALALTDALPGVTLTNTYTSTEAAPAQLTMVFDPERPAALGRPTWSGDLRITGEDGRPVPMGRTGTVWLRSAATPRRYHGADGTRVFDGRWVAMGDLGYQDEAGYLHLVDRADDLVKSGALPVSTLRVEAMLHEHPAVAAAAVVGVPHPVLGEVLAAAVVPAGRRRRDRPALLPGRAAGPARASRPYPLHRGAAVQRGRKGGQAASCARCWPWARFPADRRRSRPPRSPWPGCGHACSAAAASAAADDFFARGGDSMRAAQLATLAGEEFGVEVPSAVVFERPVLAGQAAWIDEAHPAEARPVTRDAPQAVSALQAHLLNWMHEMDPPRDVGPMHVATRIHDTLDAGLLAEALDTLVRRHDALRTRFTPTWTAGPPPYAPTCRPSWSRARRAARPRPTGGTTPPQLRSEVERPFDWRHGPLVRVVVVHIGEEEHLAALVAHHLVVDGWSMGVLLHELGLIYSALRSGQPPELPPATQSRRGGRLEPAAVGAYAAAVARGARRSAGGGRALPRPPLPRTCTRPRATGSSSTASWPPGLRATADRQRAERVHAGRRVLARGAGAAHRRG